MNLKTKNIYTISVWTIINSAISSGDLKLLNSAQGLSFLLLRAEHRCVAERIFLLLIDLAHAVLDQVSNDALATLCDNRAMLLSKLFNDGILAADWQVAIAVVHGVLAIANAMRCSISLSSAEFTLIPVLLWIWVDHLNFPDDFWHQGSLFSITPPAVL